MSTLDQDKKNELKQELLAQRQSLQGRIQQLLHASGEADEVALAQRMGPGDDWAAADLEAETALARYQHELGELRAIEAALAALDAGDYGQCVECGTDIPVARLRANPSADHCLACQEALEKRSGAHHASL